MNECLGMAADDTLKGGARPTYDNRRIRATASPDTHDDRRRYGGPRAHSAEDRLRHHEPIAAVIAGGIVTSTIHVLITTPVIFCLIKTRALRRGTVAIGHVEMTAERLCIRDC